MGYNLGFFTDPYPDELLYSVCARFGDRMKFTDASLAVQRLFGNTSTPSIDFPGHMNHLIKALPPGHNYTADYFINHHTLTPLYSPFMPYERAQVLRADLKQEAGLNHAHGRVGAQSSTIKPPKNLRFCPVCAGEDRRRYGERYWHRVHQISGIEVCSAHSVFLESSHIPRQHSGKPSWIASAERAIETGSPRFLDLSDPHHNHLLKLAQDTTWLLNWHQHNSDISFLRKRYYNLLLRRGLAYYNGRIRTSSLSDELISFYSQTFLKQLQSEITNPATGWVFRLVHTNTLKVVHHPTRHLLLITFLGYTAEEFFTTTDEFQPFGISPWPCLNKASDHYLEWVVPECQITDSLDKRARPMGTFICKKCGFIYTRIGPDTSDEARYQFNSVPAYGPVWENLLRILWKDTSLSIDEIGRKLGVSDLTVVRYAIRFGLPMNTLDSRRVSEKTIRRYSSFRPSREEALENYRAEWIAVREMNPLASRKELISIASFLYLWLRKNDAEWIESHLPSPRDKGRKVPLVDWEKLDYELSEAVIQSTTRIKAIQGKPVRASLAEVIREMGHQVHLENRLDKLPRTSAALYTHIELLEAYMIRKLEWAEACYEQEGVSPTRNQLMRRAIIQNNKSAKMSSVQSAADAAIDRLRRRNALKLLIHNVNGEPETAKQ